MSVLTTTPLKAAPSAATGVTVTPGTMPTWSAWVEVLAATAAPIAVAGVQAGGGSFAGVTYELDLGTGAAGAEVSIGTLRLHCQSSGIPAVPSGVLLPVPLGGIGSGVRVALRARATVAGNGPTVLALNYYETFSSDQITTSSQVLTSAPSGATTLSLTPSATPWAPSAWVSLLASAATDIGLLGLAHGYSPGAEAGVEFDLGTGAAGAETVITTLRNGPDSSRFATTWLPGLYPIPAGTRVAVRMRKAGTNTTAHAVSLLYYTNVSSAPAAVAAAQPYVWGPL